MNLNMKYFNNVTLFIENTKDTNKKYLLLIASKTKFELEDFNKENIKICAGIFPHVIYENKLFEEGLISIELADNMNLHFINDIQNYVFDEDMFINTKSVIAVLEGFSPFNETFLSRLFENLEVNTNIIGGAAGVIEEGNKPVLFNNDGFFSQAAILLSINKNINLAVKHGLSHLDGPFLVTLSDKNILESIDYEDAFELYKKVIKKDSGKELNESNFLELVRKYPLGIVKYKGEEIVRDIIDYKDGKLVLISEISVNSMINILKAKPQDLIEAAKIATIEATRKNTPESILMFNCLGRKEFLGKKFQEELDIVHTFGKPALIVGVTTVGEIANSGNRYINFLNKTCVIGGICN